MLAEMIRAVGRELSPSLASAQSIDCLTALDPFVPPSPPSFGFECRLSPGVHAIDLGVSLTRSSSAVDALAVLDSEDPSWRNISSFARCWRDPRFPSRNYLPFAFLEYDAEAASLAVPVPSIFVALDSPLDQTEQRPELQAARDAAVLLIGGHLPAKLEAQLSRCFQNLPSRGRALHLAVMLGRPSRAVRLSVLLPRESATAYFASLGGEEASDNVEELLTCGLRFEAEIQVDFDIGPPIAGRIGLGLTPPTRDGWPRLVEGILNLGSCEPLKTLDLLRWPGISRVETGLGPIWLRRSLSHVKLAITPGGTVEVKAYLEALRFGELAPDERGSTLASEANGATDHCRSNG